jgi:LPXTG-site transpeptidase (sortase) family protein
MMRMVRRFWYVFAFIGIAAGLFIGLSASVLLFPSRAPASTHPASGASSESRAEAKGRIPQQLGTLVIPEISINAPIEPVGRLADGAMAVPVKRQWDGVGWYQYGPLPGEQGSAVIDGHLDRPGGSPAIFWRLHDLHVGDIVMIVKTGGQTQRFRVTRMVTYQPANAPLRQIFKNDSGKYLNLITCAGAWVPSLHQTTLRLVVYTVSV